MVHIWDNVLTDRQTDKKTIYFCVTRMNRAYFASGFQEEDALFLMQ